MDTPPTRTPEGQVGETPSDVVGLAEALALLKVVGPTWTAANAAITKIKGLPPLLIQIEESAVEGEDHVIVFRATNGTPHGLYLEGISMAEPSGVSLRIGKILVKEQVHPALPVLVPCEGHATIRVYFRRTDSLLRRDPPLVKLRCDYSPLGEAESKHEVFAARLRQVAPRPMEKDKFGF